jgi:hypothetical protein
MPTAYFGVSVRVRGVAGETALYLWVAAQVRCAVAAAIGVRAEEVLISKITDAVTGFVATAPAKSGISVNGAGCGLENTDAMADDMWLLPPGGRRAALGGGSEGVGGGGGGSGAARRAQGAAANAGFIVDAYTVMLPPQGSPLQGAPWTAARVALYTSLANAAGARSGTFTKLVKALNSVTGVSSETLALNTGFSCGGQLQVAEQALVSQGTYAGGCAVGSPGPPAPATSNTNAIVAGVLVPFFFFLAVFLGRAYTRNAVKKARQSQFSGGDAARALTSRASMFPPQMPSPRAAPAPPTPFLGTASRAGLGQSRATLAAGLAGTPAGTHMVGAPWAGASTSRFPAAAPGGGGGAGSPLSSLSPALQIAGGGSSSSALPPHLRGAVTSPHGTVNMVNPMRLLVASVQPGAALLASQQRLTSAYATQGRQ